MREHITISSHFDEDTQQTEYYVDHKLYESKTEALEAIVGRACALLEVG